MTVWGLYGAPGNGKGVFAADKIEHWGNKLGLPTYGNLKSIEENGLVAGYKYITCDQFMTLDAHEDLAKRGITDPKQHALVYIDEPYSWGMDSRTPTSEISKAMAKKGMQHRKSRLDILFTTQIPSSIDKRFKHLCKVTMLALEPIEDKDGNPILFRYAYWGRYSELILTIDKKRAQQLYSVYDTEEQIEVDFTPEYLQSLEDDDSIGGSKKNAKPGKEYTTTSDGVRVYGNVMQ